MKLVNLLFDTPEQYEFKKDDEAYLVIDNYNNIAAAVPFDEDEQIEYYLTGCYNSGSDWLTVPVEEMIKLRQLCEAVSMELKG